MSDLLNKFPMRFLALTLACLLHAAIISASASDRPSVPATRHVDQVDDYHGTKVPDPFRWLEDDNSPETKTWVEAENKATFGYLAQIPERKTIKERLTKLW